MREVENEDLKKAKRASREKWLNTKSYCLQIKSGYMTEEEKYDKLIDALTKASEMCGFCEMYGIELTTSFELKCSCIVREGCINVLERLGNSFPETLEVKRDKVFEKTDKLLDISNYALSVLDELEH